MKNLLHLSAALSFVASDFFVQAVKKGQRNVKILKNAFGKIFIKIYHCS